MGLLEKVLNWFWKTLANQLLFTYLLVIAFALAVVTCWAMITIKSESIRDLRNSLEVEAVHLGLEIDKDLELDSQAAIDRIQAAVDRHASKLNVSVTVVNKSGHVLAESTTYHESPLEPAVREKTGANISNEPEINDALSGLAAFYRRDSGRHEWLYVAYPVRLSSDTAGVIRIGVPLTDLNHRINRDLIVFLNIIAATLVTTALISIWLARRVTSPIRHLSELSRHIALSGDMTAMVPAERRDEIGELVTSFNQMIGRLREEERLKQEFIANASHELKTPTMAIGSVVEALQAGAVEDPQLRTQFLTSLENLVERQSSLLRDLLDIAQLDATAKQQWKEEVRLTDAITVAVEQVRPQAEKKAVDLIVLQDAENCLCIGHSIHLQRAIINLLTNAVNYTPTGGRVTVRSGKLESDFVEVKIEDTGTGIDAKDLPHIFERFYRTDKARSRASGGTGLGLSITREIILRHQGGIKVESTPGKGSVFTITLPLKHVSEATMQKTTKEIEISLQKAKEAGT